MSTETHEIIIKSRKDQLQDAATEYKRKIQEMRDASKRLTTEYIKDTKLELDASKVAVTQKLADIKIETKGVLDAMAEQKKARLDAARQQTVQQRSQFGLTGDISQITSYKELMLAIRNAKSGVIEFGAATQMVGSNKTYGNWLNELTEKKRTIIRTTKLTSEQLIGFSRDLSVVGMTARNVVTDIGNLTSGDKSMPELALGIAGVATEAVIIIPALHGMGRELQAMGLISDVAVTKFMTFGKGVFTVTGYVAAAAGQLYAFKIIIDQTGVVLDSVYNILTGHGWSDVTQNFYQMGQALSDLNPILDLIGYKFNFLRDQALDASTAIQGVLAHNVEAERSTKSRTEISAPKGGKTSRVQSEKEIVSLIDQETKKLADLNKELAINKDAYGARLEILDKIREVTERIFFLEHGVKAGIDLTGIKPQTMTDLDFEIQRRNGRNPNIPGGFTPLGQGRPISDEIARAIEEKRKMDLDADIKAFDMMHGFTDKMLSNFKGMDDISKTLLNTILDIMGGLIKGGGPEDIINSVFGGIFSIFGLAASPHGSPQNVINNNPFNRPGDILPPVVGLPKGFNQGGGNFTFTLDLKELGIYNFMKKGNEILQLKPA